MSIHTGIVTLLLVAALVCVVMLFSIRMED